MLEFALILPIFMALILLSIDMGHIILISGAMQDAAFSAARAGAEVGGAGYSANGSPTCPGNGVCDNDTVAYNALVSAAQEIPSSASTNLTGMTIVSGAECSNAAPDNTVVLKVHYNTNLLTPGLGELLAMAGGDAGRAPNTWSITATAAARCEVVTQ
jgi:Flp pilus assembly protein TadG